MKRRDASRPPAVALTIAGSDNSCGAGAQADLKTFAARGVYGLTALTCVVSEAPGRVERVVPLAPGMVRSQVRLLFETFPIAAVKTGMLYSRAILRAVAEELEAHRAGIRLVVDPVMVASSGDPLLKRGAVAAYGRVLFPLADVVTPNLDEAAVLLGRRIGTVRRMREAGHELAERYGTAFLLKGGHLRGTRATDILFLPGGREMALDAPRLPRAETHGTGCTYAACLAAELARGRSLEQAFRSAKAYIGRALKGGHVWRGRRGRVRALNHFASLAVGERHG